MVQLAVTLGSLIALVTDLWKGKIYNWLTFPLFASGLLFSIWNSWEQSSTAPIFSSLLGACVALLLYGWIFVLGFMGAGDVKFLMAMGAWGGLSFAIETALLAVIIGGGIAAITLTLNGKIKALAEKVQIFFVTLLVKELDVHFPAIDRSMNQPFGFSLAIAAISTVFFHPLKLLGVLS